MKWIIARFRSISPYRKLVVASVGISLLIVATAIIAGLILTPPKSSQGPVSREQAVTRAQAYLANNINSVDPQLQLLLDFLHRKFNLDNRLSGQTHRITSTSNDPYIQSELKALARIAYPDIVTNDLGASPTLVARGANCDHILLPGNISGLLQQDINKGGYELTHAYLSMQLMKELDCSFANAESLRDQAVDGMLTMAGDPQTGYDLRFESMAFLMYGGKLESIKPEWIDLIYESQHPDGGWPLEVKDQKSDYHATLLALWALLEYNHPATPYEPIVHHAATQ